MKSRISGKINSTELAACWLLSLVTLYTTCSPWLFYLILWHNNSGMVFCTHTDQKIVAMLLAVQWKGSKNPEEWLPVPTREWLGMVRVADELHNGLGHCLISSQFMQPKEVQWRWRDQDFYLCLATRMNNDTLSRSKNSALITV